MSLIKRINYCVVILFLYGTIIYSQVELPERGICAHRGAKFNHPENTIPAFKEAIRLGTQMIEFDVWLTKDNKLVVIHDPSVDKRTNGNGLVSDLSLEQIKSLDAGSWKGSKFIGVKIPTFEEVLEIMPENIWLNIHIKTNIKVAKRVAEIIVDQNRIHQSVLAVTKEMINVVKEVNESLKICNMDRDESPEQYVNNTIELGFEFIQLTKRSAPILEELVKKLKENNIRINYYRADSSDELIYLFNTGVDFVLVDDSNTMLKAAEKCGIIPVNNELDD